MLWFERLSVVSLLLGFSFWGRSWWERTFYIWAESIPRIVASTVNNRQLPWWWPVVVETCSSHKIYIYIYIYIYVVDLHNCKLCIGSGSTSPKRKILAEPTGKSQSKCHILICYIRSVAWRLHIIAIPISEKQTGQTQVT